MLNRKNLYQNGGIIYTVRFGHQCDRFELDICGFRSAG